MAQFLCIMVFGFCQDMFFVLRIWLVDKAFLGSDQSYPRQNYNMVSGDWWSSEGIYRDLFDQEIVCLESMNIRRPVEDNSWSLAEAGESYMWAALIQKGVFQTMQEYTQHSHFLHTSMDSSSWACAGTGTELRPTVASCTCICSYFLWWHQS